MNIVLNEISVYTPYTEAAGMLLHGTYMYK
jgi:hypothetical protein